MTQTIRPSVSRQTALALAVLAFCSAAQAAEPENTEATVTFGLSAPFGGAAADRALFNQYRGLTPASANGVLDLSYYRRNVDNGSAVRFDAADLFGDTRSFDLRWMKQGEWKLRLNYHELLQRDANTVNSGLLGAAPPRRRCRCWARATPGRIWA